MRKQRKTRAAERMRFATLACYGPNDQHASKIVAVVFEKGRDEPLELRRWVSGVADVRRDEKIQRKIMSFLKKHRVTNVTAPDRIIGCPHEEGFDYPDGEDCPFCPFWANRDRWTGKTRE